MREILMDASANTLVESIEHSWIRAWMVFSRLPAASLHDDGNILWFTTGLPDPMLNVVLYAKLKSDDIHATIESLGSYFRSMNLPLSWHIGPITSPDNLGEYLKQYGLRMEEESIGMATDLFDLIEEASRPHGLEIVRVNDPATLSKWIGVLKTGFPMSDVLAEAMSFVVERFDFVDGEINRHYLGMLNGEPVASSTLSLSNGVASIYDVSTIPEARGQGVGTAMTLTACLEARKMGYRFSVLQSSTMAVGIYHRLGFRQHCKFVRYVYHPFQNAS